jgi:RNA polymerase sigma-70 factor (ECF subfamily)
MQVRQCARDLGHNGRGALERLYELAGARLLRYALALTRNQHDAEDVLQTALVRIALRPRGLVAARHPWAYCLRVVRNEAIDTIRGRRSAPLMAAPLDAEPGVSSLFEDQELRQAVRVAIRQLHPAQSEVVVLKVWEQMTFVEIAEVLSESPNTVASRYRYAMARLTRLLQPLCNEVLYD